MNIALKVINDIEEIIMIGMQFWLPGVLAPDIWTIRKCSKIGVPRTIL
jgi:hypothetical protein